MCGPGETLKMSVCETFLAVGPGEPSIKMSVCVKLLLAVGPGEPSIKMSV